jgi:hypothetical protein
VFGEIIAARNGGIMDVDRLMKLADEFERLAHNEWLTLNNLKGSIKRDRERRESTFKYNDLIEWAKIIRESLK